MRAWQLYRCTSHTPSQEKSSVKTHNCGTYSVCETTGTFPLVTKAVHTQRLLAPQISVDYALHSTRRKNYIFRPPKFQVDDFVLGGGMLRTLVFSIRATFLPSLSFRCRGTCRRSPACASPSCENHISRGAA